MQDHNEYKRQLRRTLRDMTTAELVTFVKEQTAGVDLVLAYEELFRRNANPADLPRREFYQTTLDFDDYGA